MHLIPVPNENYQLIVVNNMHEVLVHRDYLGLTQEEAEGVEAPAEATGSIKLVARVSVPQMSVGLVANDTLVIGTNIKNGWLQSFDIQTFEKTAQSSAMLAEAVTCMCLGEESSTLIVGMNDSKVACIKAGRNFLEVLGSFNLGPSMKTFHSIQKTSRGDFAVGTVAGVCFIRWMSLERKFEIIRQTPTSTSGPPLTLL